MGGVIDRGICLRTWDWSETSQTALIMFRQIGLLRVLAKGSRRDGAPFSGGLEAVAAAEAKVFPRHSGGLSTLASWDLEERFEAPRHTLGGFACACYMTEVVSRLVTEMDPHPGLFDALEAGLREASEGDPAVVRLQWAALAEGGHQPDLQGDPVREREAASAYFEFSPLCGRMVGPRERVGGELWRVREVTVHLLRAIAAEDSEGRLALPDPITWGRARRFLDACLRYTLGVELRSGELLARSEESGGAASVQ